LLKILQFKKRFKFPFAGNLKVVKRMALRSRVPSFFDVKIPEGLKPLLYTNIPEMGI